MKDKREQKNDILFVKNDNVYYGNGIKSIQSFLNKISFKNYNKGLDDASNSGNFIKNNYFDEISFHKIHARSINEIPVFTNEECLKLAGDDKRLRELFNESILNDTMIIKTAKNMAELSSKLALIAIKYAEEADECAKRCLDYSNNQGLCFRMFHSIKNCFIKVWRFLFKWDSTDTVNSLQRKMDILMNDTCSQDVTAQNIRNELFQSSNLTTNTTE